MFIKVFYTINQDIQRCRIYWIVVWYLMVNSCLSIIAFLKLLQHVCVKSITHFYQFSCFSFQEFSQSAKVFAIWIATHLCCLVKFINTREPFRRVPIKKRWISIWSLSFVPLSTPLLLLLFEWGTTSSSLLFCLGLFWNILHKKILNCLESFTRFELTFYQIRH